MEFLFLICHNMDIKKGVKLMPDLNLNKMKEILKSKNMTYDELSEQTQFHKLLYLNI